MGISQKLWEILTESGKILVLFEKFNKILSLLQKYSLNQSKDI